MTLDLSRIVAQIRQMTAAQAADRPRDDEALATAYQEIDDADLRARLATAKTSWLLARTEAHFSAALPVSPLTGDFAVVASDGSFIVPDRHSPARFYLINLGKVLIRYGGEPSAELTTEPRLYFQEDELYVSDEVRKVPVNGTVLGLKRATEELRAVAEQAIGLSCPTLALQDGTLILWALESQPEFVIDWVLEPFLGTLEQLRDAGVPVAAYISAPGSADVVNTLRVSVCDYPERGMVVNCDHCRLQIPQGRVPACDVIPDVTDRYLFESVGALKPGERSQVFASSSKILERYGPDFHIYFFYLNTGTEIARVEIPAWVAEDLDLLELTHAIIYDQCERGMGYPPALQEAHELAVIGSSDRRAVEIMIEEALARHGIVPRRTGKDGSKRGRFI